VPVLELDVRRGDGLVRVKVKVRVRVRVKVRVRHSNSMYGAEIAWSKPATLRGFMSRTPMSATSR